MALKLLQPGGLPLGQFDCLDADVSAVKGGEVMCFTSVLATSATDKAAYDVFDGYTAPSATLSRTVAKRATTTEVSAGAKPWMLSDDGITGYGTLFGSVVGGTVGQISSGGALLGPTTMTGSGKVTLWHSPGLYAVSLDAVDTGANGLVPTNGALVSGKAVTFADKGLLTMDGSSTDLISAPNVGNFVEFETTGSLVNTPNKLVGVLNTPDGALSSTVNRSYNYVVIYFNPAAF